MERNMCFLLSRNPCLSYMRRDSRKLMSVAQICITAIVALSIAEEKRTRFDLCGFEYRVRNVARICGCEYGVLNVALRFIRYETNSEFHMT